MHCVWQGFIIKVKRTFFNGQAKEEEGGDCGLGASLALDWIPTHDQGVFQMNRPETVSNTRECTNI